MIVDLSSANLIVIAGQRLPFATNDTNDTNFDEYARIFVINSLAFVQFVTQKRCWLSSETMCPQYIRGCGGAWQVLGRNTVRCYNVAIVYSAA